MPSKDDQMTQGTQRQILTHNNYGERLGCPAFKPKRSRSDSGGGLSLSNLFR